MEATQDPIHESSVVVYPKTSNLESMDGTPNFRKRRLSLPKRQLTAGSGSETKVIFVNVDESTWSNSPDLGNPGLAPLLKEQPQPPSFSEEESWSEEKAHTFRKRRLSLNLLPQRLSDCDNSNSPDSNNNNTCLESTDAQPPVTKRRRLSSADSMASASTGWDPDYTKPRILHSVEMIAGPFAPPSPIHQDHVLHSQNPLPPSQISALDDDLAYHSTFGFSCDDYSTGFYPRRSPRKKRRRFSWKQRHHYVDEDKLPFPKNIVGTYSCHGIEPIYDSDYEEQQLLSTNNDDDDFSWGTEGHEEKKFRNPTDLLPTTTETTPQQKVPPLRPSTTTAISAKINQDRGGITFPYANSNTTALFAVYDGHGQGGELVSQFALHEIQRRLERHPLFHIDLEKAMRETFLAVDEALKHEPIIEPFFAGTTACVALLQNKKLTLANAGDSRAVMARKREDGKCWDGIDLTLDQNPDSPLEMERILKAGGYVSRPPEPGLSARVWLDSHMTQIGLAMARSIGDHAVAHVGVIADPVVTTFDITNRDDFMILASDGVWEFLSSQEAVQIVGNHLGMGATKACQALIEAAASKWHEEEGEYRDDITAIVVRLQHVWNHPNK